VWLASLRPKIQKRNFAASKRQKLQNCKTSKLQKFRNAKNFKTSKLPKFRNSGYDPALKRCQKYKRKYQNKVVVFDAF